MAQELLDDGALRLDPAAAAAAAAITASARALGSDNGPASARQLALLGSLLSKRRQQQQQQQGGGRGGGGSGGGEMGTADELVGACETMLASVEPPSVAQAQRLILKLLENQKQTKALAKAVRKQRGQELSERLR